MNSEEMQSYLTNIEEFVFDDKRIVTYSWLSKSLGIHANLAKQLLHTFYSRCQKKEELSVTYLLVGLKSDSSTYQVSIVNEKDVQSFEETLQTITSKHIYSIQKCHELSDLNVLYAAQKEESLDSISKGISAIEFNSKERDNALVAKLKLGALPVDSTKPLSLPVKKPVIPSKNKSPVKDVKSNDTSEGKNSGEYKDSGSNTETKSAKVHPMFKNAAVSKKKPIEKKAPTKAAGIGAFFSKASKPATNTKAVSAEPVQEEELRAEVKERLSPLKENKALNNCKGSNKNEPKEVNQEPVLQSKRTSKSSKSTKKMETKKGKKGQVKKPAKDEKKRKRLMVMSDSESSNSEDEEAEVEREPSPEPEPPMVVPDEDDDLVCGTPEPSTRKRKKKLISRSFTSSDGFMETEKVLVSCSEDEQEEELPEKRFKGENFVQRQNSNQNKNEPSKETKTTKSVRQEKKNLTTTKSNSPQKTKQSSLMNFFKKN